MPFWSKRCRIPLQAVAVGLVVSTLVGCEANPGQPADAPSTPRAQFPSPMTEDVRPHRRLSGDEPAGFRAAIDTGGTLFVPDASAGADSVDLLVHFHGAVPVVQESVTSVPFPLAVVVVNAGSGSAAYESPFRDPVHFSEMVDETTQRMKPAVRDIYLSAWSAGYGAVRAILRTHSDRVAGVLLLDGLHAGYIPDRLTLHEGGRIDEEDLAVFRDYAKRAVAGEKRFLVTHSAIFPGTYASTTETAAWLLDGLGISRSAVLEWGPDGMQRLSEARKGRFAVLGFAGNTAPDHVDHLHELSAFLAVLLELPPDSE